MTKTLKKGFTLIEILVVLAIIGILSAFSLASLAGTRKTSRDGKRKADIEQIRSALEIYRADCNQYPVSLPTPGASLTGNCPTANTYLSAMPGDPISGTYKYSYVRNSVNSYNLCAYLELGSGSPTGCGVANACGTGIVCNYKQSNP